MYILIVDCIVTPDLVTPFAASHGEWVKKYVDQGVFLFAGPKKNKLGGVILVKSMDKKKLMTIIAEDSYVKGDVAEYRVIDFDAKLTAAELELLKNQ